jgi:hypothetical protein
LGVKNTPPLRPAENAPHEQKVTPYVGKKLQRIRNIGGAKLYEMPHFSKRKQIKIMPAYIPPLTGRMFLPFFPKQQAKGRRRGYRLHE